MARRLAQSVSILAAGGLVAILAWQTEFPTAHPVQRVAFVAAAVSLWLSLCAGCVSWWRRRADAQTDPITVPISARSFYLGALLAGVLPAVIETLILVMRMICAALDFANGTRVFEDRAYGFGIEGLWPLALLLLSTVVSLAATRDRRLLACAVWIAAVGALWACLLIPAFRTPQTGGLERTAGAAIGAVVLALLLAVTAFGTGWANRRSRRRLAVSNPDALARASDVWPGLAATFAALAVIEMLLVSCQLAVPVALRPIGYALTMLIISGAAAGGALACFAVLGRSWNSALADSALGLASLASCALVVSLLPPGQAPLAERYPVIFSSIIVGLAIAAALWTWLCDVWAQQLDHGNAWTTAGHLIPHVKRAAFYAMAMALLIGALLAVWPRLPGIAATDDTFGAVVSGLWANLFLLLVTLWCSRRRRRLTLHVLPLLAIISTAGFILTRLLPFASRFE